MVSYFIYRPYCLFLNIFRLRPLISPHKDTGAWMMRYTECRTGSQLTDGASIEKLSAVKVHFTYFQIEHQFVNFTEIPAQEIIAQARSNHCRKVLQLKSGEVNGPSQFTANRMAASEESKPKSHNPRGGLTYSRLASQHSSDPESSQIVKQEH